MPVADESPSEISAIAQRPSPGWQEISEMQYSEKVHNNDRTDWNAKQPK
jgi:hypothetical protein